MGFLEKIYEKSYNAKRNNNLMISSIIIVTVIILFLYLISLIKFKEVYNSKGILVPKEEMNLSLNYDGLIITNNIEVGKIFKKNDIIVKLDKDEVERNIFTLQNELSYLKDKIQITRSVTSRIDIKLMENKIKKIERDVLNLKESFQEKEIVAPFDCIIVASDFKGIERGFIPRGYVVCKVITLHDPYFKVAISEVMVGKIKKNQSAIITIKKKSRKVKGKVVKIEIGKEEEIFRQYAFVDINETVVSEIGMEAEIKIIMEKTSLKQFFLRSFGLYATDEEFFSF